MSGRVGYRFHPTDEELVNYFLKHKMNGYDYLVDDDIRLIDLYKFDPWDLPELAAEGSNDQVWYFFYRRELKYKNSSRPRFNRSTNNGHWKPTGSEHPVKAKDTKKKIGTKRTLVFYSRASPKDVRTNWVIHEYQTLTVLPYQKDLVLCKLKEKADGRIDTSGCDEAESSRHNNINRASDRHLVDTTTPIRQVDPQLLPENLFAGVGNGINFNPSSSMQPQIHIEEGLSLDDLMFNGVFDNDLGEPAFQYDTDELEEDPNEMADSFIVVPEEYRGQKHMCSITRCSDGSDNEETARTHLNRSSSLDLLTGVYLEDIDDLYSDIVYSTAQSLPVGASNLNNGHANSREYRQTRRVQAITETLPSSTFNQSGKEKNQILVMEASCSSSDSTTDSDEKINSVGKEFSVRTRTRARLQQSRSGNIKIEKEVTPKTSILQGKMSGTSGHMRQRQSITGNIKVGKGSPRSSLVQGKMSGASEFMARGARKNGTGLDPAGESPKENINVKKEKELKMANAKTSLELRDNAIAGKNKTGSFIRLETSPLSQTSNPLSEYAVNLVVGLFLFIFVIWELLILH